MKTAKEWSYIALPQRCHEEPRDRTARDRVEETIEAAMKEAWQDGCLVGGDASMKAVLYFLEHRDAVPADYPVGAVLGNARETAHGR